MSEPPLFPYPSLGSVSLSSVDKACHSLRLDRCILLITPVPMFAVFMIVRPRHDHAGYNAMHVLLNDSVLCVPDSNQRSPVGPMRSWCLASGSCKWHGTPITLGLIIG